MARLEIAREEAEARPRRRGRQIALRLDGSAWLQVTAEELAELGLVDGAELDDGARTAAERALVVTRTRLFVVRSLAARAQSVAELEAKLEARGAPADVAGEALALARSYGYLDDEALAAQLAQGQRARGIGRRRAEHALRRRGLAAAVVDEALAEAYAEEDETALARTALGRRSFGDGDAGRRRAVAFLARRGFSSAAAWGAVRAREREDGEG